MNRIHIKLFFLGFFIVFIACKQISGDQKKVAPFKSEIPASYEFEHLIRMPEIVNDGPFPLLILIHGLGSNEQDLYSFAEHLDKRLLISTVRAPNQIGANRFSWYDFDLNGGDFIYSFEQLNYSRAKLLKYIEQIKKAYNIDSDSIYIGGFSQGAIMSLATALNHSDIIAGAMVLSGDLLDEVEAELNSKKINEKLSIYMSHGRRDPVLTFAEAEKDAKYLDKLNINFEEHWFDSKHTISTENFISMNQWLTAQLQ